MEELRSAQSAGLFFAFGLLGLEIFTFKLLGALGILDIAPYLIYWDGLGALLLFIALVVVNGFIAYQIVKKLGFRFDVPRVDTPKNSERGPWT